MVSFRSNEDYHKWNGDIAASALVPYKEHAVEPVTSVVLQQQPQQQPMKELEYTTPTLPPIEYSQQQQQQKHNFALSPTTVRRQYILDGGDPDSLPAILHNSLGKLEMNFLQQQHQQQQRRNFFEEKIERPLEIAHEAKMALENHQNHMDNEDEERKKRKDLSNGGGPHKTTTTTTTQQANGVLKVAMYGEFPISASANIPKTNGH